MDYENANKALDKSRAKNRDVLQAETSQQLCCHKFEKISESAKQGGFWVVFRTTLAPWSPRVRNIYSVVLILQEKLQDDPENICLYF